MLSVYSSFCSLVKKTADTGDNKGFFMMQPGAREHVCACIDLMISATKWISALSQSGTTCDINLKFKDNICLPARQQPASTHLSHTLKRPSHNAEIQTFTRHASIEDEIQIFLYLRHFWGVRVPDSTETPEVLYLRIGHFQGFSG